MSVQLRVRVLHVACRTCPQQLSVMSVPLVISKHVMQNE